MECLQKTDAERLVQTLDQEIRSRGRGSIRAVDRAVGYDVGWWQNRAKSKNITVHQLLKVLDHLGLNPAGFMRRALGPDDGILVGGLELNRPRGEPPMIVAQAWDRVRSGVEGTGLGTAFLDTLDEQRYQKPEEVVSLAQWAVDHVELELLPRLLGVVGSAWRPMLLLDEAEHAIYAGIEITQERGDRFTVGNLLRYLSSVAGDRGDRAEALRLAEKAAMVHLRSGDRDGIGRALVAQGICLYYLGRAEESIETLKSALGHLPAGPSRSRFAALQVSGLAHQSLGNLSTALENVEVAQEALPDNDASARGKLLWLWARIHADLDEFEQASSFLAEVITIFRRLHYGETALATCELVRIEMLLGQPEDAYHTAISMRTLLDPLRHNKIISAAIADLLRSGQAGLTLALIKRVTARIEGESQRGQIWGSLRIKTSGE
jgi:tetratricopeptide (TPR) repeat protein